VQAQSKKSKEVIVVEELTDHECLKNVLGFEGFLFKTDLNDPNTSEFLNYGLSLHQVEKDYPYLIKAGPEGKYIAYEQLIPILVEALEETFDLLNEETVKRMKMAEDYANYKITMDNHLQQLNYQLGVLRSEIEGINENQSVD
jgi:hypothetical protein